MTNVTMKAVDTLHISTVGPHSIPPGGEFEVSSHIADDLEARGLAKRKSTAKAAQAPDNKMEAEPENKAAATSTVTKRKGK